MNNNIRKEIHLVEITPDKNGRLFATFFGTTYEIKIKKPKEENAKPEKKSKK